MFFLLFRFIFMGLFLIISISSIIYLFKMIFKKREYQTIVEKDSALSILNERLARGEISEVEYVKSIKIIKGEVNWTYPRKWNE